MQTVLLGVIAVATVIVAIALLRPQSAALQKSIGDAIEHLGAAVQHHVEVNAVLALTRQFESDPGRIEQLGNYSRQTVAAALAYHVDSLGSQLKVAEDQLSSARSDLAKATLSDTNWYQDRCDIKEGLVDDLHSRLAKANDAIQQFSAIGAPS